MRHVFLVAHHPIFRAALAQTIEDQCQHALAVVGESGWGPDALAAIGEAQPDVVVAVVGIEVSHELRAVADIHRLAPACRVLVIDSLGDEGAREADGWGEADALLRPDQVLTMLVPAIWLLAARQGRSDEG